MDQLANAIIHLNTSFRSALIVYFGVEQKILINRSRILQYGPEYEVGSVFEGLPKHVCSDVDFMKTLPIFPDVFWQTPRPIGGCVMAEQNPSEPAYLRLKAVKRVCLHKDFKCNVDNNGYLMTNTFIDSCKYYLTIDMKSNSRKNGPSVEGSLYDEHYAYTQKLDMVFCLKCQSWPPTTKYFIRERLSNWPSQKLLDKISHLDCFVVPVGHPSSVSKNTEWRLSFSLAEKELIHDNMFAPFHNCMYALKAVKKMHIIYSDSVKPTPFCSYFIKTACLWMCETLQNKDYSDMCLIRRVLDWLIDRYKHRNLPHYFIPEQNLIGHLSVQQCEEVRAKLTNVKTDIWTMVMSSVDLVDNDVFDYRPIEYLCDKLGIPRVSDYDELRHRSNFPWPTEFLEQCISEIRPCGEIYRKAIYYKCWEWTDSTLLSLVFSTIDFHIKMGTHHSEILRIPEEIILPILEKIEEIAPEDCGEMVKTHLYRILGNAYTYLLIHFQRSYRYNENLTLYQNKPLYYYELGAKMRYFNKWSDFGIGGLCLEVQYHYLLGNYEALKMLLLAYKPVLKLAGKWFFMNILQSININPSLHSSLVLSAWATDERLHQLLKRKPTAALGLMNPIVFVFYVMARVYVREGDLENASTVVKKMEICLQNFEDTDVCEFTKSMIELIEIEILEVTRMLYSSNELTPLQRPALVHILDFSNKKKWNGDVEKYSTLLIFKFIKSVIEFLDIEILEATRMFFPPWIYCESLLLLFIFFGVCMILYYLNIISGPLGYTTEQ